MTMNADFQSEPTKTKVDKKHHIQSMRDLFWKGAASISLQKL